MVAGSRQVHCREETLAAGRGLGGLRTYNKPCKFTVSQIERHLMTILNQLYTAPALIGEETTGTSVIGQIF